MFLKRIFSRPPPPEPAVESFSLDSLKDRVTKMMEEKMEKARSQLTPLTAEINRACAALATALKELYNSDPDEEVHLGLMKSAMEARKLIYDKISRSLGYLNCPQELTSDSLIKFNERISKATDTIADAMKTHGRYVRAVFGQKYLEFESCLRELHEVTIRAQSCITETTGEIQRLNSILSEISLYHQTTREMDQIGEKIKSLRERVNGLEAKINEGSSQLTGLKSSPEFKRATGSAEEFERIKQEISRRREIAAGLISELNRPLRKLEKLVRSGEHRMAPELQKILEVSIKDPAGVIASEETIAAFERLLREAAEIVNSGKIDLDKRERKNLLDAARDLSPQLQQTRNTLITLTAAAEAKKRDSENPVVSQAAELENSIRQQEHELKETLNSIEQLERRIKLMQGELVSRKGKLMTLASEALGVKVEITS
ncbi:MAG: hypothetical protein APZ16_02880 [Candidatus Hadarchaeum yellowstonense]|uniref:Uncharacterized protein n=1 Tax=Hadarchaeum yellowstonense TaxID=1776334 RepID=A0A147K0L5_HADYE|nr:MAG: hypothetical protein APZ16_02880 [Candidatus Hadarchaeum yellowstonense]